MDAASLKILALVLLALSGAARADSRDDEPDCSETPRAPKVFYKTAKMETFDDPGEFFDILYGEDITAFCIAGDFHSLRVQKTDKHLNWSKNETFVEIEELNSTSIRWNINRPDVGRYRYRCEDTISGCQDTLYFMVAPLASVVATGVRYVMDPDPMWDNRFIFYVPFGETYQIFCTGSESKSLKIHLNSWTLLPTFAVNDTTVTYEGRADKVDTFYYTCSGEETAWFEIIVDYPPQVEEFQCTSYNYDKLACTWRSLSTTNTFNLYDMQSSENPTLLCSDRSGGTNKECKWNKRFIWDTVFFRNYDISLRFRMQTCNKVYCHNQTFEMTHISITKLEPVSHLAVTNSVSHGVVVSWPAPHQGYSRNERKCFKHVYKVEYRLLQKRWHQADASTVNCDSCDEKCELKLKLDCPEQHYEVRVYVRLEAAEDRLWSEPASKSFYTAPAADDAPDPACHVALQEPEPISSEMALSELFKLIKHTLKSKSVFRKQVCDLGPKLDEVKSLMASLEAATD